MRKLVKFNNKLIRAVVIRKNDILVYKNHFCKHCGKQIPWNKCHKQNGIPEFIMYHFFMYRIFSFKGKEHPLYGKCGENSPRYGIKQSQETKDKIGKANGGKNHWNYKGNGGFKKGEENVNTTLKPWNYGLSCEIDSRIIAGENHYNWKDGASFEPYCEKFNNALRKAVRRRDKYTCQLCGRKQKKHKRRFSVHHVHFDKRNCYPDLVTLCIRCHVCVNYRRKWSERKFMKILKERNLLNWEPNFNIT